MFHFPCCGSHCGSSLVLLLRERCFFVFTCALTFCTDDFHARFFAAAIPNTTTLDRTDLFQVELTAFLFLFFLLKSQLESHTMQQSLLTKKKAY